MSRPQSAASSHAAGATTNTVAGHATGHKRGNSNTTKVARSAFGPSTAALFLTNLRLLNLDTQSDWPAPTPSTFTNHDAKARIRCAEWALYHLFIIYDPALAADKLRPFFPPLEPLQSINLRAALYRCLEALRKNGVLGRETVLRKTMLDECSGDKFMEVCLAFSAVVLRKTMQDSKRRRKVVRATSITERLTTVSSMSKSERESLLPLAVAHKAALSKVLLDKERKRQSYCRLHDLLVEKHQDLQKRRSNVQRLQKVRRGNAEMENLIAVQRLVERAWSGHGHLRDAVLLGDEVSGGDGFLQKPFDDLWVQNEAVGHVQPDANDHGVLESLQVRAQEQNDRLRQWQQYHQLLASSKPVEQSTTASVPEMRFELHRELSVRSTETTQPAVDRSPRSAKVLRYDEILTAMREELKRSRTADAYSSSTKAQKRPPLGRIHTSVSFATDAETGAERPKPQRNLSVESIQSQTPQSPRPGMGSRSSSRPKSHEQRRVTSQTGMIPLKSEIFSPLKRRPESFSPSMGSVSSNGSAEDGAGTNTSRRGSRNSGLSSQGALEVPNLGLGIHAVLPPMRQRDSSPSVNSNDEESTTPVATVLEQHPASNGYTQADPQKRQSLAERTRQSIAISSNTNDSVHSLPPQSDRSASPAETSPPLRAATAPHPAPNGTADNLTRRASLMERTRHSIALAPQLPVNASIDVNSFGTARTASRGHARTRTSLFPVNQFEPPQQQKMQQQQRPSSVGGGAQWLEGVVEEQLQQQQYEGLRAADAAANRGVGARRDITPREKLFDADAQYGSVFKSRPKVKQSPVLSPQAGLAVSGFDLDGETPSHT